MSGKQCKGTTKQGTQCPNYAVTDSEYCFTHDPAKAAERAKAHSAGGRAKIIPKVSGEAVQIADTATVMQLINKVILDTWELENTAGRSRALLSAADMAIKALQIGELEERVKRLEQIVGGKQHEHE